MIKMPKFYMSAIGMNSYEHWKTTLFVTLPPDKLGNNPFIIIFFFPPSKTFSCFFKKPNKKKKKALMFVASYRVI